MKREDSRTMSPGIQLKRAYESPEPGDGVRVLVDRLWARGVSKEDADLDSWMKELGPTAELRKWFGHRPERWGEFEERYLRELATPLRQLLLKELHGIARGATLTLVYGARCQGERGRCPAPLSPSRNGTSRCQLERGRQASAHDRGIGGCASRRHRAYGVPDAVRVPDPDRAGDRRRSQGPAGKRFARSNFGWLAGDCKRSPADTTAVRQRISVDATSLAPALDTSNPAPWQHRCTRRCGPQWSAASHGGMRRSSGIRSAITW